MSSLRRSSSACRDRERDRSRTDKFFFFFYRKNLKTDSDLTLVNNLKIDSDLMLVGNLLRVATTRLDRRPR